MTGKNLTQEDKSLFAYLWKHDPKYPRSRSKGTNDDIAREYGEKLYCENIHDHTCYELYDPDPSCNQCKKRKHCYMYV